MTPTPTTSTPCLSPSSLAQIERDLARGFVPLGAHLPRTLVREIRRLQGEVERLEAEARRMARALSLSGDWETGQW